MDWSFVMVKLLFNGKISRSQNTLDINIIMDTNIKMIIMRMIIAVENKGDDDTY